MSDYKLLKGLFLNGGEGHAGLFFLLVEEDIVFFDDGFDFVDPVVVVGVLSCGAAFVQHAKEGTFGFFEHVDDPFVV